MLKSFLWVLFFLIEKKLLELCENIVIFEELLLAQWFCFKLPLFSSQVNLSEIRNCLWFLFGTQEKKMLELCEENIVVFEELLLPRRFCFKLPLLIYQILKIWVPFGSPEKVLEWWEENIVIFECWKAQFLVLIRYLFFVLSEVSFLYSWRN